MHLAIWLCSMRRCGMDGFEVAQQILKYPVGAGADGDAVVGWSQGDAQRSREAGISGYACAIARYELLQCWPVC